MSNKDKKKHINNGNASKSNTAAEDTTNADTVTEEETVNAEAAAAEEAADKNGDTDEDAAQQQETLSPQEQAEAKAAQQFDHSFLKAVADMENIRRRNEKSISDAYKFALSDFVPAIGEVRDCLETAINNADDIEKLHEGVSLTLRKLVSAMDARHILPIRPDIGAMFDPAMHMAIGMLPATATAPEKTVAAVIQVGYMLNGRIIRPANVMVSKQAEAENKDENSAGKADDGATAAKKPKNTEAAK